MSRIFLVVVALLAVVTRAAAGNLTLVEDSQARCVICVAPAVMAPDHAPKGPGSAKREAEAQRQRLRESVKDLSLYLQKISGAKVEIVTTTPANTAAQALPILIGDVATQAFGPVGQTYPYKQAFRVVIGPRGIGLMGESDLATSYAIYELLDRLGCRWYMPGEMGEVIPTRRTLSVAELDFRGAPATIYRGGARSDAAFFRRNRLGGMPSQCGFGSVEGFITAEQRREHPDWVAVVGGKPHPWRLRWSNPDVAQAIAQRILKQQAADPQPTVSWFVGGGSDFDESAEDRALDTGKIDPIFHSPIVSDRLMVLTNRVAQNVAAGAPNTLLLLSAYTTAIHAPQHQPVNPNVVPIIVASAYDRAHPITDTAAPGNSELRRAIEGWGKASRYIGCYAYAYNLAEPTAPNPMIGRWTVDVPFLLANKCRFWIPESQANFETSLPGLWLAMRLTWNAQQNPMQLTERLMADFYGQAGPAMAAYWQWIDDAWTQTPEYAGAEFAYPRRFTPERLVKARQLMDAALAKAVTPAERYRVEMADQSLQMLQSFMALHDDLAAGRFAGLKERYEARRRQLAALARRYAINGAFGGGLSIPALSRSCADADRIQAQFQILTSAPLRSWRCRTDPENHGLERGYSRPAFDDSATSWTTTDPCTQTWSTLGSGTYFGPMWYRATVRLPEVPAGKKVYLWLSATEGSTRVFVNGQPIRFTGLTAGADPASPATSSDAFTGYCQPVSFDITAAVRRGDDNQITLQCTRSELNELGIGGLLGPVVLYAEKPAAGSGR
jgi:hypothetical protein